MQRVTAKALATVGGGSGLFSATRLLRNYEDEDEELMRLQAEMMKKSTAANTTTASTGSDDSSHYFPSVLDDEALGHQDAFSYQRHQHVDSHQQQGGSASPSVGTATQRYFKGSGGGGGADNIGAFSALERRRTRTQQRKQQQQRQQQETGSSSSVAATSTSAAGGGDLGVGGSSAYSGLDLGGEAMASVGLGGLGRDYAHSTATPTQAPSGEPPAKNTVVSKLAFASTALGDADAVAEAMRVIESHWIGHEPHALRDYYARINAGGGYNSVSSSSRRYTDGQAQQQSLEEEDEVLAAEEHKAAARGAASTLPSALNSEEMMYLSQRFADLPETDSALLTNFIGAKTTTSISETIRILDGCKSAEDVERVYKQHISKLPLWSDALNGHGTRVAIMGKMTEVVARTFCVDQWLEITSHARRFGFQLTRLHVNEVLTAIRIDLSAMFHQRGRDPQIVLRTLERLQTLIHFSKEDHIRWEGVFIARLCLICTVLVSFMDRQNYYRGSFPSDFHRREGVVGDWVITHVRAIDYDETVRVVDRFLRDHGLEDHRHALKIRPSFTTAYRLIDYYFASDNLSQLIATVEDCMQQGVNIAESTIAKMMQLIVSFNHPRAIDLFRKYRLRMPEAVIATPDISRLMTFYCRSGGGLPCPCCGEKYNHRNVELAVWDATPTYQRRCPLLQMARGQRGEFEELARNEFGRKGADADKTPSLFLVAPPTAQLRSASTSDMTTPDGDQALQDQLMAQDVDPETLRKILESRKQIVGGDTEDAANLANASSSSSFLSGKLQPNFSPTSVFVDLPQCRDWSHVAFSLFEYSKENSLLWTVTEWRLFIQSCTYLREPEEILALAERDVRRARALRKKEMAIVPENRWAVHDPPQHSLGAAASRGALPASRLPFSAFDPCGTNDEIASHISKYDAATIKVPYAFAKKYKLLNLSDATTKAGKEEEEEANSIENSSSSNNADPLLSKYGLYDPEDASSSFSSQEREEMTISVPFLKLSRAAKFELANSIIKNNLNFVTQVDDFVQRLYMRFLRCNNPQEANTRINKWFMEGVGSGRGAHGGEITPIASEEVMIAAFSINERTVNNLAIVGGGRLPTMAAMTNESNNASAAESYLNSIIDNNMKSTGSGKEMAGIDPTTGKVCPNSENDGIVAPPIDVVVNLSLSDGSQRYIYPRHVVAKMREEAASFAASRVQAQDLFVTAFAKRRSRYELFKSGFLIKVHKKDIPRSLIDAYHARQRSQNQQQSALYNANSNNAVDEEEDLSKILLPPIDISKYSDDRDAAEKDYMYMINPRAYGAANSSASDFRFTSKQSVMASAAKTDFAHLVRVDGETKPSNVVAAAEEEAKANEQMLRKFVYLIRKKPRNLNARATFKDSGSDISPGFNKKNWYLVPRN